MNKVLDIFNQGPQAVMGWVSADAAKGALSEMDIKELADICWTRANTLSRAGSRDARAWALAALAGYDFLSAHGSPMAAESGRENAAELRTWSLVKETAHAV